MATKEYWIEKSRKERTCDYCGVLIPKGSNCIMKQGRYGTFEGTDSPSFEQIGIYYYRGYFCSNRHECEKRFEIDNPDAKHGDVCDEEEMHRLNRPSRFED